MRTPCLALVILAAASVPAAAQAPRVTPACDRACLEGYIDKYLDARLANDVSPIRDRRFVAVDRERGIVYAFAFFDHDNINWTWQLAELFRIENGQIRRVEAIFHRAPYGMPPGWSTFEQAMSESIQSVR